MKAILLSLLNVCEGVISNSEARHLLRAKLHADDTTTAAPDDDVSDNTPEEEKEREGKSPDQLRAEMREARDRWANFGDFGNVDKTGSCHLIHTMGRFTYENKDDSWKSVQPAGGDATFKTSFSKLANGTFKDAVHEPLTKDEHFYKYQTIMQEPSDAVDDDDFQGLPGAILYPNHADWQSNAIKVEQVVPGKQYLGPTGMKESEEYNGILPIAGFLCENSILFTLPNPCVGTDWSKGHTVQYPKKSSYHVAHVPVDDKRQCKLENYMDLSHQDVEKDEDEEDFDVVSHLVIGLDRMESVVCDDDDSACSESVSGNFFTREEASRMRLQGPSYRSMNFGGERFGGDYPWHGGISGSIWDNENAHCATVGHWRKKSRGGSYKRLMGPKHALHLVSELHFNEKLPDSTCTNSNSPPSAEENSVYDGSGISGNCGTDTMNYPGPAGKTNTSICKINRQFRMKRQKHTPWKLQEVMQEYADYWFNISSGAFQFATTTSTRVRYSELYKDMVEYCVNNSMAWVGCSKHFTSETMKQPMYAKAYPSHCYQYNTKFPAFSWAKVPYAAYASVGGSSVWSIGLGLPLQSHEHAHNWAFGQGFGWYNNYNPFFVRWSMGWVPEDQTFHITDANKDEINHEVRIGAYDWNSGWVSGIPPTTSKIEEFRSGRVLFGIVLDFDGHVKPVSITMATAANHKAKGPEKQKPYQGVYVMLASSRVDTTCHSPSTNDALLPEGGVYSDSTGTIVVVVKEVDVQEQTAVLHVYSASIAEKAGIKLADVRARRMYTDGQYKCFKTEASCADNLGKMNINGQGTTCKNGKKQGLCNRYTTTSKYSFAQDLCPVTCNTCATYAHGNLEKPCGDHPGLLKFCAAIGAGKAFETKFLKKMFPDNLNCHKRYSMGSTKKMLQAQYSANDPDWGELVALVNTTIIPWGSQFTFIGNDVCGVSCGRCPTISKTPNPNDPVVPAANNWSKSLLASWTGYQKFFKQTLADQIKTSQAWTPDWLTKKEASCPPSGMTVLQNGGFSLACHALYKDIQLAYVRSGAIEMDELDEQTDSCMIPAVANGDTSSCPSRVACVPPTPKTSNSKTSGGGAPAPTCVSEEYIFSQAITPESQDPNCNDKYFIDTCVNCKSGYYLDTSGKCKAATCASGTTWDPVCSEFFPARPCVEKLSELVHGENAYKCWNPEKKESSPCDINIPNPLCLRAMDVTFAARENATIAASIAERGWYQARIMIIDAEDMYNRMWSDPVKAKEAAAIIQGMKTHFEELTKSEKLAREYAANTKLDGFDAKHMRWLADNARFYSDNVTATVKKIEEDNGLWYIMQNLYPGFEEMPSKPSGTTLTQFPTLAPNAAPFTLSPTAAPTAAAPVGTYPDCAGCDITKRNFKCGCGVELDYGQGVGKDGKVQTMCCQKKKQGSLTIEQQAKKCPSSGTFNGYDCDACARCLPEGQTQQSHPTMAPSPTNQPTAQPTFAYTAGEQSLLVPSPGAIVASEASVSEESAVSVSETDAKPSAATADTSTKAATVTATKAAVASVTATKAAATDTATTAAVDDTETEATAAATATKAAAGLTKDKELDDMEDQLDDFTECGKFKKRIKKLQKKHNAVQAELDEHLANCDQKKALLRLSSAPNADALNKVFESLQRLAVSIKQTNGKPEECGDLTKDNLNKFEKELDDLKKIIDATNC